MTPFTIICPGGQVANHLRSHIRQGRWNKTLTLGGTITANSNATIASTIAGTTGLIKNGTGTLTFNTGNNTYSGGIVINAGMVAMGANNGAATNVFGKGTITFGGSSSLQPTYNSGGTVLTNAVQVNSGVTMTISHPSSYYYVKSSGPLSGDGTYALSGASAQTSFDTWSSPSNTFTGALYDPAGINICGGFIVNSLPDSTNKISLGDISGYAGAFQLGSGTATPLVFNQRQIEMLGTVVGAQIVNNNTTASITINTPLLVTGVGAKTLTLSAVAGPTNVWGGNIANGNLGGTNSGTISVTKSGTGIWVLSGTNTYSGATTVSAGTLLVNNTAGTGTGTNAVTVSSGATLGGTGTLGGAATFKAGAKALFTVTPTGTGDNNSTLLTITGVMTFTNTSVHLTLPANLGAGTYTLAASSATAVTNGLFSIVVDSGSFATGLTATNIALDATGQKLVLNLTGATGHAVQLISTGGLSLKMAAGSTSSGKYSSKSAGQNMSGTALTLTATHGTPGGKWTLLHSTNLAIPLSQWETNCTGIYDNNGNLSTDILNTTTNQIGFFILK